ncbi:MAG TPA: GNAT family N-acetyltransferase [Thermoanaerobaculia bacterium]|nr:GNAT family N-acetyltransferase [Thermoanaerobaculia bacterium]
MTFRPARPSDAAAIAVLATQLGYPSGPEESERRLRALAERSDHAVLVAEADDGAVVAWCHVGGALPVETDPFAEILGLVVDESRRGQGIGERLVEAAADWAAGHGYRTLRVRSNVVRERTHRFYERLGFARVKSQVVFSRTLS